MTFLLLWGALQVAQPGRPLDPKDARSLAEHVLYNTRSQRDYMTCIKSRLKAPGGDAFERQGTCVWTSSGLLAINSTGSGGEETCVVRAGELVWIRTLGLWLRAEEAGRVGAGRGIENPDEVLTALGRHLDKARTAAGGGVEFTFAGEDLVKIAAAFGEFDPAKSTVTLCLEPDSDMRVRNIGVSASLQPADSKAAPIAFTASIEVTGYNKQAPIRAVDGKGKEIPYSQVILDAIKGVERNP